jgi:hypothetical protein
MADLGGAYEFVAAAGPTPIVLFGRVDPSVRLAGDCSPQIDPLHR